MTKAQATALQFIADNDGKESWEVGQAVKPKSISTWRSGAIISNNLRRKGFIQWRYKQGWLITDEGRRALAGEDGS